MEHFRLRSKSGAPTPFFSSFHVALIVFIEQYNAGRLPCLYLHKDGYFKSTNNYVESVDVLVLSAEEISKCHE